MKLSPTVLIVWRKQYNVTIQMAKTCSKLSLKVVYHDFKRDKNRSGLDVTIKGCYISLDLFELL